MRQIIVNWHACVFSIMDPEHYRQDGTCLCTNAEHRKLMIEQWEYTEEQFSNIPLLD